MKLAQFSQSSNKQQLDFYQLKSQQLLLAAVGSARRETLGYAAD